MTALLRRRLQKIEGQIVPSKEDRSVEILIEPRKADSAEVWAKHRARLAEAQRTAEKVIVVGFDRSTRQDGPGNVVYEPFDVDTIGKIFALKRGSPSFQAALDEGFANLSGNVFLPNHRFEFAAPVHDDD
jgi:hypothetical protein